VWSCRLSIFAGVTFGIYGPLLLFPSLNSAKTPENFKPQTVQLFNSAQFCVSVSFLQSRVIVLTLVTSCCMFVDACGGCLCIDTRLLGDSAETYTTVWSHCSNDFYWLSPTIIVQFVRFKESEALNSTPHRAVQQTDRYSTPTGTAHRTVQHTERYSTPTGKTHQAVQHTDRYNSPKGTAHRPVQHTERYNTPTGTPPRRHTSHTICIRLHQTHKTHQLSSVLELTITLTHNICALY